MRQVSLPLVAAATLVSAPLSLLHGQELTAVLVHGEAVEEAWLILEPESLGMCLWGSTYNLRQEDGEPSSEEVGPTLTLSFFTKPERRAAEREGGDVADHLLVSRSRFHTRLRLTPENAGAPPTERRKEYGDGPFESRAYLTALGEFFLARLRIPTRTDPAGNPVVRNFTERERESLLDPSQGSGFRDFVRSCGAGG
jgi:hypothetical protein